MMVVGIIFCLSVSFSLGICSDVLASTHIQLFNDFINVSELKYVVIVMESHLDNTTKTADNLGVGVLDKTSRIGFVKQLYNSNLMVSIVEYPFR